MKYESISTRGIEHAQPSNANNRMHNKPEVHHPLPGPLSGACGFGSSSHSLRQPGCQTFLTAQPFRGVCVSQKPPIEGARPSAPLPFTNKVQDMSLKVRVDWVVGRSREAAAGRSRGAASRTGAGVGSKREVF